jgi:hypothetical protein
MNITTISVRAADGPLTVEISAPLYPQALAGVLWRYTPAKQPDGKAGQFTPQVSTVPLGPVTSNHGKFFMLEGVVLHQNDNPPTPYQAVITISQLGKVVSQEVPSDGGSGQIGSEDVLFVYRFQIQEVS